MYQEKPVKLRLSKEVKEMYERQMVIEDIIFGVREQKKEMEIVKKKYVQIPNVVEAIKWTGENLMEVHKFLGEDYRIKCSIDMLAINGEMVVPKDHYIILYSNGDMLVAENKAFLRHYIPAEVK